MRTSRETIVVTKRGKPVAALVPVTDADWETIRVSSSPVFQRIIARSRKRQAREGGISSAEMRRRLNLPAKHGNDR
jgi:antitoxin (DNA-binding transcriptional repressor) of toxin-antitoxin stability system